MIFNQKKTNIMKLTILLIAGLCLMVMLFSFLAQYSIFYIYF